jgi:hypothetical protein
MRVKSQTSQELVVEDSSVWFSYLCAGAALFIIYFSIAENKINGLLTASFFLLCAMIADRRVTFTFDGMQRVALWKGKKFFKVESGAIPFDDITEIGTEASDSDGGTCYRLSILTRDRSIPMAYGYTGSADAYAALRQQILDFIRPGSYTPSPPPDILSSGIPADLEPSIRSLLAQGRKIDAVTLLRSTQHIGLTDAMSRIEALDQTMKARI